MDSWNRFEKTTLPLESSFYSKLNMYGVSDQNYEHTCKVWRDFEIKNLGEYHDLYLRTDVILLANVFESFRHVCLDNYGLDPAPGLAWKACLKKTGIRLDLLLDPDMLLMVERETEEELPNQFTDRLLQTIHIWVWNINLVNQPGIYNIWMQTTCMGGQCLNLFLH